MTAISPPALPDEDDFEPELEDELESELSEPHAASASTAKLRAATSRPRVGLNISYSSVERCYVVTAGLVWVAAAAARAAPRRWIRCWPWSRITARTITAPLMSICQNVETPTITSPSARKPMTNAPIRAPRTLPRPPISDVPPMTPAAIAFSSNEVPAWGAAEVSSEAMIKPAIAAQKPEIMYTRTVTLRTGTPASSAARALPPSAYTQRPNGVLRVRKTAASENTTISQIPVGMRRMSPEPKKSKPVLPSCGLPSRLG